MWIVLALQLLEDVIYQPWNMSFIKFLLHHCLVAPCSPNEIVLYVLPVHLGSFGLIDLSLQPILVSMTQSS